MKIEVIRYHKLAMHMYISTKVRVSFKILVFFLSEIHLRIAYGHVMSAAEKNLIEFQIRDIYDD